MKLQSESSGESIHVLPTAFDVKSVIREFAHQNQEDPFYILNLGDVVEKHGIWKRLLPRVAPFYAVKCNDSPIILELLAALGLSFDCASRTEVNKILDLGVEPERIIFANPAKPISHIRHAEQYGINLMTCDSEIELIKIQKLHPNAKVVIRIRCDDVTAQCVLGMKFGCCPDEEAPPLMRRARELGLQVVGISFHVGSGCRDMFIFDKAIRKARTLFDFGIALGFEMNILDLGGGFPGTDRSAMEKIASVINITLNQHFPSSEGVKVIAEPGRYYVASAYTLATSIHSMRNVRGHRMYYINDGVYSSFNAILYDHYEVTAVPLDPPVTKLLSSSIWGPTCDSMDRVIEEVMLPELEVGSCIYFENMGAYTMACAVAFNGFPIPKVKTVVEESLWQMLREVLPLSIHEEDDNVTNSLFDDSTMIDQQKAKNENDNKKMWAQTAEKGSSEQQLLYAIN